MQWQLVFYSTCHQTCNANNQDINEYYKLEVLTKSTVNNAYSVIRNSRWRRLKLLEYDRGCVVTVTHIAV